MSFELPATLSIRVFRPNWVYGGAVVFFGLCALLTSEARSYASVMVLRLLLGFGESVIQTGFVYLSLWYTNKELTTRCGMWLLLHKTYTLSQLAKHRCKLTTFSLCPIQ